jgi:hypothetical protein
MLMSEKKVSFEEFTRAVADMKLDEQATRPTAHTSSVVDFSNWDEVRREVAAAQPNHKTPRSS